MSALLPQVFLTINGVQLPTNENVKNFRYTSRKSGHFLFSADLFDPTLRDMERLIRTFLPGEQRALVDFTFGYPSGIGIEDPLTSLTKRAHVMGFRRNFRFPYTLDLQGVPAVSEALLDGDPVTYEGKASDVAGLIADKYNLAKDIEVTDDDYRLQGAVLVDSSGQSKFLRSFWVKSRMSDYQFLQEKVRPLAVSQATGAGGYVVRLGAHPSISLLQNQRGVLTFKPVMASSAFLLSDASIPTFTWFAGRNDDTIEFIPQINDTQLGSVGTAWTQVSWTDPKEKLSQVIDRKVTDAGIITGGGVAVDTAPGEAPQLNLRVPYDTPEEATAAASNAWFHLFAATQGAELLLVGKPEAVILEAGQYIRVLVVLPTGELDYTSGFYLIDEIVHDIDQSYTVRCQLKRAAMDVGLVQLQVGAGTSYPPVTP